MATEVVNAIGFDEAGNDIHVITLNNDDYTTDKIAFSGDGVFLERDTVDRVFIPWSNVARVYQEI